MDAFAHLSPRVRDAMALVGSPRDLRLRTTLRRDDVDVWTSLLVPHNYYECLVRAPQDVLEGMRVRGIPPALVYETRDDAEAGHNAMCDRVGDLLRDLRGHA